MRTETRPGPRRIGLGLLALLAAVMVFGWVTDPVAAGSRKDAVKESNEVIGYCYEAENGTEAYVIEGDITVHCFMSNGSVISCYWEAANDWAADCVKSDPLRPRQNPARIPLDQVPSRLAA